MCAPSPFYSSLSCPDKGYEGGRNTKLSRQLSNAILTVANHLHVIIGKFFRRMPLPSPRHSISNVVSLCPDQEVIRVDARRIIAGVPHDETIGYLSLVDDVRQAGCADDLASPPSLTQNAVPTKGRGRFPRPVFVRVPFVNLGPKTGYKVRACNNVNHAKENTNVEFR